MKFVIGRSQNLKRYARAIQDLEAVAEYPLGDDFFKIDHGENYFAYFERLGEVHSGVALDGDRVAATGTGVLKSKPMRAWYLCDLKVHPQYRGRHLPLALLGRAFLPRYLKCRRGFGVSMNPPGKPNPVLRLLQKFKWAAFKPGPQILIYSFDANKMRELEPVLRKHRGPVSYMSPGGKKDLVLRSSGLPMPLFHAQFGPCAEPQFASPKEGGIHMFCSPENDALATELKSLGASIAATATVIHHRMDDTDWSFLLTSDI